MDAPEGVFEVARQRRLQSFATGIWDVLGSGRFALKDGGPTGAATGRFVKGRAAQGRRRAARADGNWST